VVTAPGSERLRRVAANAVRGLGIDPAGRRQRIAQRQHLGDVAGLTDDVRDAIGADVAGGTVADAVGGAELGCAGWPLCVLVVAEAQPGAAIVVDFGHEVGGIGRTVEQVALRLPARLAAVQLAVEHDLRKHLVHAPVQHLRRRCERTNGGAEHTGLRRDEAAGRLRDRRRAELTVSRWDGQSRRWIVTSAWQSTGIEEGLRAAQHCR
jgi:hypothetical protein